MDYNKIVETLSGQNKVVTDGIEYCIDSYQRSLLFMDILRKRGNIYLDHIDKGQPPVLVFDYDLIMDARTFERPANYALVKIRDRRQEDPPEDISKNKRKIKGMKKESPYRRPLVIIDPRAGHGPGIGGSKQNSEIGLALTMGHPVYFVMFYTEPEKGQTLADVKNAEIKFLEEVKRRHPKAPRPTIIGNCQGGWAATLVGASRPDLAGPLLLNGSPLSYWSGVTGENPMRYTGGIFGGVWLNSLLGDLGNGQFDGANLVMNMENLNPANTLWKKLYNVYEKVDTEEERFLKFEKWWGGFFLMTTEEIHRIVQGLFIGNDLVHGRFDAGDGEVIDLKQFNDPVVVFASKGDNITPPQQALNWIPSVYNSVDEIKRHGQVIVYIIHPKIGHLGIFVATSIAKKEQNEIMGSVEMIHYLSPGLYEMVILEKPSKDWLNDYKVSFVPRTIDDILKYDDGQEDEEAFHHVATLSNINDSFYRAFISPFVKTFTTPQSAEILKQLHPLRTQRYMISDLNPMLAPVKAAAPLIKENRQPASDSNLFSTCEKFISDMIEESLTLYGNMKDIARENLFTTIYDNDFVRMIFPEDLGLADTPEVKATKEKELKKTISTDRKLWLDSMEKGGYPEGLIRILIAVAGIDESYDRTEFITTRNIVKRQKRLKELKPDTLRQITKEQSRILQTDFNQAMETLPKLIKLKRDQKMAVKLAEEVVWADGIEHPEEKKLIKRIKTIFGIEDK